MEKNQRSVDKTAETQALTTLHDSFKFVIIKDTVKIEMNYTK